MPGVVFVNYVDIFRKFCLSCFDDFHHLFFQCHSTKHLISLLNPRLSETFKKPTSLPKHTLLYNFTEIPGSQHIKMTSLIYFSIFQLHHFLDFFTLLQHLDPFN